MKRQLVLSVYLLLSGCGTINTAFRDDAVSRQHLKDSKTYCDVVPRVYSGVAYDFCRFNGAPVERGPGVPLLLFDFPFSGVLDTVLLPYTIYQQNKHGSIELY